MSRRQLLLIAHCREFVSLLELVTNKRNFVGNLRTFKLGVEAHDLRAY